MIYFSCCNMLKYTHGTDRCYYAACSHVPLLYLIQIYFRNSLLHAHQSITDCFYSQVYAQFYVPGPEVPAMTPDLVTALKDDRFSHLKMSNHAFQCYLGLWRAININTQEGTHLLPTASAGQDCSVVSCSLTHNQRRRGHADQDGRHLPGANWYSLRESHGLHLGACKLGIGIQ